MYNTATRIVTVKRELLIVHVSRYYGFTWSTFTDSLIILRFPKKYWIDKAKLRTRSWTWFKFGTIFFLNWIASYPSKNSKLKNKFKCSCKLSIESRDSSIYMYYCLNVYIQCNYKFVNAVYVYTYTCIHEQKLPEKWGCKQSQNNNKSYFFCLYNIIDMQLTSFFRKKCTTENQNLELFKRNVEELYFSIEPSPSTLLLITTISFETNFCWLLFHWLEYYKYFLFV